MAWPLSQDYNEVIQDPANSFGDAELKTGEAVTNALGIPLPRSGNFADVYEVRCPSGSRWAVKCFTREVAGLRERYNEISKFLHQVNLPFMVDFQYQEQGIRVRGRWYPILKMQWVEGFVLNEFVRINLDKKPILQAMGQIWLRMARRLRETNLAHCDLQHGNVLLVPGSTANSLAAKLIDYDGMCVPALAGSKSGEVGHPAFQHPERLRTGAYNQEVDRFSLLVIATALRCLTVGGRALWERYDNGDNLLFRQVDFQEPAASPLFKELLAIGDPQAQTLVKELYRACQGTLDKVPLLTDLIPEEKPAGKVTTALPASSAAIARQPAGAQGPDWDFNEDEAGNPVVKKRRASGGMPLWVWGALGGGAAALLLVGVGLGVGLGMRRGPADKEGPPIAQHKPDSKNPNGPKNPPEGEHQPKENNLVPGNGGNNLPPNPANDVSLDDLLPTRIFRLTPAADKLAISSVGGNVWRLVNPNTGEKVREFTGHTGPITGIAFSADGSRALTAARDLTIRLWNTQTGDTLDTIKVKSPIIALALSPDGRRAAYAETQNPTRGATVWDLENRKHVMSYQHRRRPISVAFSPSGEQLLCGFERGEAGHDEVMMLWPLVQGPGRVLVSFRAHPAPVTSVAVSPDGKYVVSANSGETHAVSLWEAKTGKFLWQGGMQETPIRDVSFSPDNRFVAGTTAHYFSTWRVSPRPESVVGGGDINREMVFAGFRTGSRDMVVARCKGDEVQTQMVRMPAGAAIVGNPPAVDPRPAAGWDAPINPLRDCIFSEKGGKLTITVPGKGHDLSVENRRMTGPRLLRDVEGDFTAEVRVAADFSSQSIKAAGLFMMADDNNYIRLERSCIGQSSLGFWELRQDGKQVRTQNGFPSMSGAEVYLRLERQGDKFMGSHSTDRQKWTKLTPYTVELPQKLKIGVDAIAISEPFSPTFDQFQLKQGQGEMVRIDKWLLTPETVVANPAAKGTLVWDKPIDPKGKCKFEEAAGKLTITIPHGNYNVDPRGEMAAPRLLGDVTGDFTAQVRVGGNFRNDGKGQPFFWTAAGLILWSDDKNLVELKRGLSSQEKLRILWESRKDGRPYQTPAEVHSLTESHTSLRLERRGNKFLASYSEDGKKWIELTPIEMPLPDKVKVGVIAATVQNSSTSTFDQFQFKQGQGEMVSIDKWLTPGETVVVKPPQPKPLPQRRAQRQPVPDPAEVDAAVKDLKTRLKDEYKGDYNQLRNAFFNELNQSNNDQPRKFAVLRELRDTGAERSMYDGLSQAQMMAQFFDVNVLEMKCIALEKSMRAGRTQPSLFVDMGLPLVDQAVGEENYEAITRLVKDIRISTQKLSPTDAKRVMAERVLVHAESVKQEHQKLQADLRTLEADPDDAKANLAVGKFHCLTRGDWEDGLPLLARGSDAALKALAQKDLANPGDANAQASLGDDWRKYAAGVNAKPLKAACQKRAQYWYELAAAELPKGPKLESVKKSKTALAKTIPQWWQFTDFSGVTPEATGTLRILPPRSITTRQYYRGAVDITVVAQSGRTDLNISIGSGGRLTIGQNFDKTGDQLRVYRPNGAGNAFDSQAIDKVVTLPANSWFTIRWQVTPTGMKVWLDGKLLFEEDGDYALNSKYPVMIHCGALPIELKSVTVKPGPGSDK